MAREDKKVILQPRLFTASLIYNARKIKSKRSEGEGEGEPETRRGGGGETKETRQTKNRNTVSVIYLCSYPSTTPSKLPFYAGAQLSQF